ncbi:hypothetical protein [Methylocystis rosea]|uniref:Uncharacterized protein n=1 Tax=Methylocystis rosea TaxID=173366 RepID=A0A3G8M579_9HYPH|nr:hypothetical protein [Methylocystis rosea]AZG76302.1 hypothetical protein EHO51_05930 [Methylocystis rosea]
MAVILDFQTEKRRIELMELDDLGFALAWRDALLSPGYDESASGLFRTVAEVRSRTHHDRHLRAAQGATRNLPSFFVIYERAGGEIYL